jgi:RNA polymerase sigma factor (TIGR02999 family)
MSDVTQILSQIEHGDPQAASQLLPLVYDELRRLAAARLAQEKPGQTLEATALVHEAYLRLAGGQECQTFENRAHFFAAAAEAMRRILIEHARSELRQKRGGNLNRASIDDWDKLASRTPPEQLLEINEALDRLAVEEPSIAQLVKLRFFAGLSLGEAAEILGLSRSTAYEQWAYARAWLKCALQSKEP